MADIVRTSTLVSLVGCLGLAACDVGAIPGPGGGDDTPGGPDARPGGGPTTPDAPTARFSMAMNPPNQLTSLGAEVHYTITVTSSNFGGALSLAATGVPATWQATLTPSSLSMTSGAQETVDLKLVIPSDTPELTANLGITGTGAPGTVTATGQLTVNKEILVTFKDGIGGGDHQLPTRIEVLLGTKLRVMDSDNAAPHRVHSDATAADGFPHQDNEMSAGQEYDVTPTVTGEFTWYCHKHGTGTGVVTLVVK